MANPPWVVRRLMNLGYTSAEANAAAANGDTLGVIAAHAEDHERHSGEGEGDVVLHSLVLKFENALA